MLHGGVPTERRPALLDRFREQDEVRVLLSTEAGGVGLNLQVASYVIHLDLPWNPARLDQRTSRAHRMGQTRGVTVTYLCAEDGIERGIEGTLAAKRAVRAAALDAASTVETVETPSFNVMLRQVREILERMEEPGSEGEVEIVSEEPNEAAEGPSPTPASSKVPAPEVAATVLLPASGGTRENGGGTGRGAAQARDRLRLARVVLGAGFPADAVRAAYQALACAIAGLLDEPPSPGHGALVAAVYRELLPAGRLPAAAHAALAMLHDLTSLDVQGVAIQGELATQAVSDAEQWVERLSALPLQVAPSNGERAWTAIALAPALREAPEAP
jgi:hypothetical protein